MAAPMRKSVEIFYDVVSPYSWIGFEVMIRYQQKWNIDLKLKPFLLGALLKSAGNQRPALVPNKAAYMNQDLIRISRYFQVPLRALTYPDEILFVKGTLAAMRFLTAVDMSHPQYTEDLSRELWVRAWSNDQPISEAENFVEAGKKAGLSDAVIEDAVEKIKTPEVKDRLKAHTQEALDQGVFGAPTFIAHVGQDKHMVFGSDRFHILADLLGEKYMGPLNECNSAKL